MNVSDFIFDRLAQRGVRDIFTVTGGGIMHLVDALGRNSDIRYWCNHHEQACAIAAEGYARATGDIGVCLVTTGPGATNALSGIAGAWVDSIPVLVISGQVRTGIIADYSKHRQIGPQEIDIVSMAKTVTKYAKTVMPGEDIRAELDRALEIAMSGRPGPVWLNIPLDVQSAPAEDAWFAVPVPGIPEPSSAPIADLDLFADAVRGAKRPVVVCGYGVHLARAEKQFEEFVARVGAPVVATIGGMDLLAEENPLYLGRFGPTGQRRANFTVQNADLLICIGASMSVASVGFDSTRFAPQAKRIMVNIDPEESTKPLFPIDVSVVADLRTFFAQFAERFSTGDGSIDPRWIPAVQEWKAKYPIVTSDYFDDKEHVNSYVLVHRISELMKPGQVVLSGNGLDAQSLFHSFALKEHQRLLANSNYGAMGWDLPATVGACLAGGNAPTVLVTGDGSFEMNVQELLTIGHNRLNIKIFVVNNGGYQSIRTTQDNFMAGRYVGCHAESGVGNPDFRKLAEAYGLAYHYLRTNDDLEDGVPAVLAVEGPVLCEVNASFDQERNPRISSRQRADGTYESCPLDDQYPFLPAEERQAIMNLFAHD